MRGYLSRKNDCSLFSKCADGSLTILVVYVDDILLVGDNVAELDPLKHFLDTQFKIKDLGLVHYFLGLEITSHPQGHLTQQKFTFDLLSEFHCDNYSPVSAPLDASSLLIWELPLLTLLLIIDLLAS